MKIKFLSVSVILLLFALITCAQNTNNFFQLQPADKKVTNSLYNQIQLLDSRTDTTNFGIVQLGAFNKKTMVKIKKPFGEQISDAIGFMADSTAKNGKLILNVRHFFFAEVTGAMSEKGYCYFKGDLYAQESNGYYKLAYIDTVSVIAAMDVTKALLKNSSNIINGFISNNLTTPPNKQEYYSFADLMRIDSIEKSRTKLYTTQTLNDGIYQSFSAFSNQEPNITEFETTYNNTGALIKVNENGKKQVISPKTIYAVVKNGKPFIATNYGYFEAQKKGNDFYFQGRSKVSANSSGVITASIFFGVVGGLIASNQTEVTELKIDHLTGEFIRTTIK